MNDDSTITHLSDAALDRLRAGLAVDEEARAFDEHLRACAACRSRATFWDRVTASFDQRVRTAAPARRARGLRGAPAFAAAAVLVLSVGIAAGLYLGSERTTVHPQAQESVPDIYADLDFYLWLMQRHNNEHGTHAPNG